MLKRFHIGYAPAQWRGLREAFADYDRNATLVQVGLVRHPDLPNVPLLMDLATNESDRKLLEFFSSDTDLSRSLVTTQDVPADRVAALRKAFDAARWNYRRLVEVLRVPSSDYQRFMDFLRHHNLKPGTE